ncbi:HAMP domain-containing protein [Paenibacillus glucanolyticus]|uniref:CHASE3 domain-containing protein n=1 Tax=Paenibacillus TaxID=44249 RepID=UPI0003E248DF|nr:MULTISPECIES: CHASE3 domain-containing protein [Paenibacillus]ANA83041.1 histidine kinase [Paenibacillus glucanolyticus]AVV57870.1 HAMP domain-containing protein [Paenibacillus glucanolyticus]ETT34659.1 multi-sensor hybrid histidine kinase [Paenibacillus sp. FSL R5-808]OMF83343.1 histidine kinase [Paenibacillus glucanolyticus]
MSNNLKINIRSKIVIGYLLILLCLGAFLWIVSDRISSLQQEADFIEKHDIEVHNLTHEIEKDLLEMETGQRGYVITGDETYLEPFNQALSSWQIKYNKLYQLVSESSEQANHLENIKENIQEWITNAGQPAVQLKQLGQDEEALHFFINDPGQQAMNSIHELFLSFRDTERELTTSRIDDMKDSNTQLLSLMYALWAGAALITICAALIISKSIVRPISQVTDIISDIVKGGNMSQRIHVRSNDEVRQLADTTNELLAQVGRQNWAKDHISIMSTLLQSSDRVETAVQFFIHKLALIMKLPYGAVFINRNGSELVKAAAFADPDGEPWNKVRDRFLPGEGLVGQCMLEQRMIILDDIPPNYVRIESGLGDAEPTTLLLAPVMFEGQVLGVIELAKFKPFDELEIQLLEQLNQQLGVTLNSIRSKMEIQQLYHESQTLNEELQSQTEELQTQTEELQAHSVEMHLLNERLGAQKEAALIAASELENYAKELEKSSKYKSQFLANMSHELRTPLNSMLILSQILSENKQGNLTEEEQHYASVIHNSGSELLNLINDILDLSKVEAGKMQIEMDLVNLTELPELMEGYFSKSAESKNLEFEIEMAEDLPDMMYSDGMRLHQILRNLLSNAIKFTESGSVKLSVKKMNSIVTSDFIISGEVIAFSVEDTGIGIAAEHLQPIFEAFQQGEETTARRFGGTGLGLSISLHLAKLLGGYITVESEEGSGSLFVLYLPLVTEYGGSESLFVLPEVAAAASHTSLSDIRIEEYELDELSQLEHKTVLIVDDDIRNVYGLTNALEKLQMTVHTAQNGYECLEVLNKQSSINAVLLDLVMPEMDGIETMKRIRENSEWSNLPIIVMSSNAMRDKDQFLADGANGYIHKPVHIHEVIVALQKWVGN